MIHLQAEGNQTNASTATRDSDFRHDALALNAKTAVRSHLSDRRFRLDSLPRALAGAPSGISQMLRTAEYDAGEPNGQATATLNRLRLMSGCIPLVAIVGDNRANPGFSSETAGLYTGGAAEARAIARDPARGGSQAYDDALTAQAQARRQNLEPLEQGPLGQLAQARDTAAATQAVLPARPLVGGEAELADAVTRLRARDPDLTNELIRQRLADQFDVSATRLVGGEAQGGGARFAKDIAGTEQQARNLDAILEATGGPAVRQPIADVLDVLRATGTRKPQGSPTDFNQQIREAVGEIPLTAQAMTALRTGGASLLTQAGDGARRVWFGRNNRTLAEILTAPDSVGRIGTILQRGTATPYADAALRQALQSRGAEAVGSR